MTKYRTGKSILTDYPTEAIIDEETGERWYDGIKPNYVSSKEIVKILNQYQEENEQLKAELKRCKEWLNSDKYDYLTTLAFIKSKGYSLKDVLEYEKGDVE